MEVFYTASISLEDESTARSLLDGQGYVSGLDYQFLFFEDSITVELFSESAHAAFSAAYPGI